MLPAVRVAAERQLRILRPHVLQRRDVVQQWVRALRVWLRPSDLHECAVRVAVLSQQRGHGQEEGRMLHTVPQAERVQHWRQPHHTGWFHNLFLDILNFLKSPNTEEIFANLMIFHKLRLVSFFIDFNIFFLYRLKRF